MNLCIAACVAGTLVWAADAKAQCPASQGAQVSVEVTASQVETAFDTNLPELERLARAAGRAPRGADPREHRSAPTAQRSAVRVVRRGGG